MIRMSGKAEFRVLAMGNCISMHGGLLSECMAMFLIYNVLLVRAKEDCISSPRRARL